MTCRQLCLKLTFWQDPSKSRIPKVLQQERSATINWFMPYHLVIIIPTVPTILNISPQHWGSRSPETSPSWVRLAKVLLHHFAKTNPPVQRLMDAPLQCRLFQPKVQGTSSEPQMAQIGSIWGPVAGIQGTNNRPVQNGVIMCEFLLLKVNSIIIP